MVYGPKYFTYIAEELPELVNKMFRIPQGEGEYVYCRSPWAATALCKIGFSKPENFGGIGCFSGGVDTEWVVGDFLKEKPKGILPIRTAIIRTLWRSLARIMQKKT